jgi:phosphonopyruvate decarboxylase
MSVSAAAFIDACTERGYDFFAGVPCSFIRALINGVITSPRLTYVGGASEGEVLGITSGAWIAGRKTVAMCQNSGFGNMVNPLTSLNRPFGIPTLLITTWRGEPGVKDEPQHEQMGRILRPLIECLELSAHDFPEHERDIAPALDRAAGETERTRTPVVLVMRKGAVDEGAEIGDPVARPPDGVAQDRRRGAVTLSRTDAIRIVRDAVPEQAPIIATTGMTGRELFALGDRPNQLYTVGSMGCASAIGLGLALGRRNPAAAPPTLVLDGDGAALMKLGNLATIGHERPQRFVHVVLNNGTHDSTGGQHTAAANVDFAAVAVACGYANGTRVDDADGLAAAIAGAAGGSGPYLVEVSIKPGTPEGIGRPTLTPREVIDRFRATVGQA